MTIQKRNIRHRKATKQRSPQELILLLTFLNNNYNNNNIIVRKLPLLLKQAPPPQTHPLNFLPRTSQKPNFLGRHPLQARGGSRKLDTSDLERCEQSINKHVTAPNILFLEEKRIKSTAGVKNLYIKFLTPEKRKLPLTKLSLAIPFLLFFI